MLKMMLTGVLGNDAEIKDVGNRKAINLSIAVKQDYMDSKGNKVEKTDWIKAVLWKKENQSTKITEYLKKGKRVYVEGIPSSEGYKTKDGEIKSNVLLNVKDIELLSPKID